MVKFLGLWAEVKSNSMRFDLVPEGLLTPIGLRES